MILKKLNQYSSMTPREQNLYVVSLSLIKPFGLRPVGYYLESLFISGAGFFDGDLSIGIEGFIDSLNQVFFKVCTDPTFWGTDFPNEEIYSVEEVRTAIKETLLAYGVEYPEHQKEALEVIKRYQL